MQGSLIWVLSHLAHTELTQLVDIFVKQTSALQKTSRRTNQCCDIAGDWAGFNTTLNTYSASVGAVVARNDPPSRKYVYEGPQDERTRDECVEMGAAGALTRAQIEEQFPGGFVDRGGYACRHQWVPVAAADDVNTKAAKREREKRKAARETAGKKWNPQTPRQQAEARG